jgi:uncharacterized repeat protein (TIGR01451 family)/LPXTG-motif cell wall-anchored protein
MFSQINPRLAQLAARAGTMLVLAAPATTASACHPLGAIQKSVEDVTTHSATVAADTAATALTVHPGDTLVYHITVTNLGGATNDDDMPGTLVTDDLPAGLELVTKDPDAFGTVVHGASIEHKITVKVTASAGAQIKNSACFTGDSVDHQSPQKGCDVAFVNVIAAPPTPSATPTPSVTPSATPSASPSPSPAGGSVQGASTGGGSTLPQTGASLAATALGLGSMAAATVAYARSRKRRTADSAAS